ncbi:MAG: hypothetical protein RI957_1604 [Verrucomicrobiota bacterium]
MKLPSLWSTHVFWLIVAIASFVVGFKQRSASDSSTAMNPSASSLGPSSEVAEANSIAVGQSRRRTGTVMEQDGAQTLTKSLGTNLNVSLESLAILALRDPSHVTRRLAFARLLESMTPENAAQIRQQMSEIGADGEQWRDFQYSLGAMIGKAAFEDPENNKREGALAEILSGWAASKPQEALAMWENLPKELEGKRDELTRGLVGGLADTNRPMATALVLRLQDQGYKDTPRLMEMVATETLRADGAEAASIWSDQLPDGAMKGAAMNRIAGEFARNNPEAAAKWVARYADQDFAASTIERVTRPWTEKNPQAAVSWLESLPAGRGQNTGLQTAFNDWEDRDPAAATKYLSSMPNSPQRDTSISGFASGYAWQNPKMAIQWAGSISDPKMRQNSLTQAGQIYFRQNPTEATKWLQTSGLAPEIQQQIMNPPRR